MVHDIRWRIAEFIAGVLLDIVQAAKSRRTLIALACVQGARYESSSEKPSKSGPYLKADAVGNVYQGRQSGV